MLSTIFQKIRKYYSQKRVIRNDGRYQYDINKNITQTRKGVATLSDILLADERKAVCFFLSRRKVYPRKAAPSREKTIVRTLKKTISSNTFFSFLDGSAVPGWIGFRRKAKEDKGANKALIQAGAIGIKEDWNGDPTTLQPTVVEQISMFD